MTHYYSKNKNIHIIFSWTITNNNNQRQSGTIIGNVSYDDEDEGTTH